MAGTWACAPPGRFRQTFVASLHGLRTIGRQGMLPSGGEAILSYGLSDLLALHWVRILAELSERMIRHEQNKGRYKCEPWHGFSALLTGCCCVRVNLPPGFWLPAELRQ